jgi:hypothetical protein
MYIEGIKAVNVHLPVADAFAGTKTSTPINMSGYQKALFVLSKGAGAVGTSTITLEMASAADGTGATAIPFRYKRILGDGNTEGSVQTATATGFNTVAAADDTYLIEVDSNTAVFARGEKKYIRVKGVEVVDDPVTGSISALLLGGRFTSAAAIGAAI